MFNLMPFEHSDRNLFNYLDNLERSFFTDSTSNLTQFRTDIIDKGSEFVLQADLPGFKKEEIKIDLNNDTLSIRAEHNEDKEVKEENFVRRERRYGSFSRSFDISNIDRDKISASYNDGVLELTLPKLERTVPAARQIEVK